VRIEKIMADMSMPSTGHTPSADEHVLISRATPHPAWSGSKSADDELCLSEAQSIANIGSWNAELLAGILSYSKELIRILQWPRQQLRAPAVHLLDSLWSTMHVDDRERVPVAYHRSLAATQPYQIIHRLQLPNGSIKWVESSTDRRSGVSGHTASH
jgi:hypothetical protein